MEVFAVQQTDVDFRVQRAHHPQLAVLARDQRLAHRRKL